MRAINAAAWLMQLGGKEIYLYRPPLIKDLEIEPEPIRVLATQPAVPGMTSLDLNALLDRGAVVVFDVDRRHAFEKHHFRGAWSTVPDRLPEFVARDPTDLMIVVTSSDGYSRVRLPPSSQPRQSVKSAFSPEEPGHGWPKAWKWKRA